jgi:hypothetical protein
MKSPNMFMIRLHTKLHTYRSNGLLLHTKQRNIEYRLPTAPMLLLHITQKYYPYKTCIFSKVYYHNKFQNLVLRCINVSPASEVGTTTVLALLIGGNWKYKGSMISCSTIVTPNFIKSIIFWDITPCRPLNFNWRFGGTYRLHLQDRRISLAIN